MTQEATPKSSANKSFPKKLRSFILQSVTFIAIFVALSAVMDYWRGKSLPSSGIPSSLYTSISNQTIDIAELSENNLTVVYFWATWCGPCTVTSPSIEQLAKHYPVVTVAMASGQDSDLRSHFKNDATNREAALPILNDNNQTIAQQWGVKATPTVLFIKDRKILGHTMGASVYPSLLARAWWLNR